MIVDEEALYYIRGGIAFTIRIWIWVFWHVKKLKNLSVKFAVFFLINNTYIFELFFYVNQFNINF